MKHIPLLLALALAGCATAPPPQPVSTAPIHAAVTASQQAADSVAASDDKIEKSLEVIRKFWPGGAK